MAATTTGVLLASALAAGAIGAGASAYSQSKAQSLEGKYQSQIAETNAQLSEIQANEAIRRGEQNAAELKKRTKRLIGSQRAGLAAQGLDLSLEGSDALQIQEDTAAVGAMDVVQIKNDAWREAWGYRVQAENYRTSGAFASITSKNKARQTIISGGLNVGKDALTGLYTYEAYKSGSKVPKVGS